MTRSAIVSGVFLALHLLPFVWRPSPLWGTDLLFYHPPLFQGLFILAAVLLFVPTLRNKVRTWIRTVPLALWDSGRRTWITKALLLLAALAVFVALRTANHLLGDGYLYLREMDADLQRAHRAPLAFDLIWALHDVGGVLWGTAETTYRIYSYASGVLYVLLTFAVAGTIGTCPRERTIVLSFLLTGGYLQLFFGYVETYALCVPGVLLYLLLGMRVLENRMSIHVPALLLSLLVNLHLVFGLLAPSLLLLAYCSYRNQQEKAPRWEEGLVTVVCFPLLGVLLFHSLSGTSLLEYMSRTGGGHFLPVFAEPGFRESYRLFSMAHLLDFINLQILSAPAACMALFLLKRRDLGHHPFLLASAAFPLLFTFLVNPEIGAFRDWDFLALPAVPLTLWAASALLARMRKENSSFHIGFLICAAAALHSIIWIGLNARPTAAESRYVHLMDRLTGHAASYGWETLGSVYFQAQDKPAAAIAAYQQALNADPDNPRHWRNIGVLQNRQGQDEEAITYLSRAIQIDPNLTSAYFTLGISNQALNRTKEAKSSFEKLLELYPDHPEAERIKVFLRKTKE